MENEGKMSRWDWDLSSFRVILSHFGENNNTEIEALTANIALVKNNASVGGKLAARIAENEMKKTKSRLWGTKMKEKW
jgi:hypothetical protein